MTTYTIYTKGDEKASADIAFLPDAELDAVRAVPCAEVANAA